MSLRTPGTVIDARQEFLSGVLAFLSVSLLLLLPPPARAQAMPDALASAHIQHALADIRAGATNKAEARFRWLLMSDRYAPDRSARYLHALSLLGQEHPLRFSSRFALSPSTNLQRNSSEDHFLIFPLDDPESGFALSLGATASLRQSYRDGRNLFVSAGADAKFATAQELNSKSLTVTLGHEWLAAGQTTTATLGLTQVLYPDLPNRDTSPDFQELRLTFGQAIWRDAGVQLSYAASLSNRDFVERNYSDGPAAKLSARISKPVQDFGRLTLSASVEQADLHNDSFSYRAIELGSTMSRHQENGLTWDLGLAKTWRDYRAPFEPLDTPRQDRRAVVTLGLVHDRIKFNDTTPRLACSYEQQSSNVALYAFESFDCTITVRYEF